MCLLSFLSFFPLLVRISRKIVNLSQEKDIFKDKNAHYSLVGLSGCLMIKEF